MSIDQRLEELGVTLPPASAPAAGYVNYVLINGLLFISGKGGSKDAGKLGREFDTAQGYQFARQAGIEVLAVVKSALGTLDKVRRVVKIQGYVNAEPHFTEHHKVLDGCSELMFELFGEKGQHARSVQGVASLRDNLPIVIDAIFAVEEN